MITESEGVGLDLMRCLVGWLSPILRILKKVLQKRSLVSTNTLYYGFRLAFDEVFSWVALPNLGNLEKVFTRKNLTFHKKVNKMVYG